MAIVRASGVEPLSSAAWVRIERAVWARLDELPPIDHGSARLEPELDRRWWWLGAPVLAFPAAVAVLALRATGDARPAAHARLVAGESATSLAFGDAHVTLDPHSALTVNDDATTPGATLERGAAWLAIAPQSGRERFVTVARDAVVYAAEGRFRVERHADELVVEVERGLVEVAYRGSRVIVGACLRWTSRRPVALEPIRD